MPSAEHPTTFQCADAPRIGEEIHTRSASNVGLKRFEQSRKVWASIETISFLFILSQCNVKGTRTVHLTRHANQTNVWTLVHSPFVGVEQSASLKDTRASVSAPLDYKETPMCLAQKLVVNLMKTALTMKSVTFQAHHRARGNVWGCVSPPLAPKGPVVRQRTTRRYAPAFIHCKEMVTLLV